MRTIISLYVPLYHYTYHYIIIHVRTIISWQHYLQVYFNSYLTNILFYFSSECYLSDIATLTIVVSDFNDNTPVFERSSYTGRMSTIELNYSNTNISGLLAVLSE